ncbi:tRNA(fMet)-specific endonuclease VapC [Candidatus Methylomirabilis lanthanidiphila]|uniref:Ribonuclease VapC n=1 Tax=Candidatus Methylomirabilis lanthanidiphila TaxID=2211376 RepID=A0A564ZJF7_9BACT|nr:type II toxin-antitoxin system VapC family toxin [Candidatus Methylomirabilis lanthanidiphila]VUZ85303.1 tRNA(fMet)-specific endonuclease VapC [Candidatus Methylomirabilis lanthanidiphila]
MVLIDTNIAVSLWVENDWTHAARRLLEKDSDWRTESFALIEFANVMATYVRMGMTSEREALSQLDEVEAFLSPGSTIVSHPQALSMAIAYKVLVYDARFLVAARKLGVKLVTEDAALRRAAPELTQSLNEALAA